ncbi:hypothetical protein BYT27DRAFT_7180822 [Phlegmacium glaucopus]|nr:hypothetical protein BYT27DRAFT_7180822 [Phlegmacium glaucopus]
MAYRSHTASPCESASQSPSSSSSSTNVSPYSKSEPLDVMVPNDDEDSRRSTSQTRTQNAGKGGCWTCRVRRKKCDEQREGDSCKTCKRLTLTCLGWGAKRPEWMRDKKKVDEYKARIKAQLSRAGLIRGQPRHAIQAHSQNGLRQSRPASSRSASSRSGSSNHTEFDSFHNLVEPPFVQNHSGHLMAGMPGANNSGFDQLTTFSDGFDPSLNFPYPPSLPTSSYPGPLIDPLNDPNFSLFNTSSTNEHLSFLEPLSPYLVSPVQTAVHEELVMYYFSNVQKIQIFFAEELTDATYAAVVGEPRGAVTLAICALADLHSKQMRVSQGLEALNSSMESSTTTYLRQEAFFKLESSRNTDGRWSDNDAIAALHLVSFSQLSGGSIDWEVPFNILLQWLMQQNLVQSNSENSWMTFLALTPLAQLLVKATLWVDVFSSLSLLQPPKFSQLWKQLLPEQKYWVNGNNLDMPQRLRMDLLSGCPDEAMLAIAEVSALAHWKTSQLRSGCLSYPELIRRGTLIEQQLRQYRTDPSNDRDARPQGTADGTQPTQEYRSLTASIFREAAHLYLHTVLSSSIPGVPEINTSVGNILHLLAQLPPGDIDRSLVFPICFAGCMTNDSSRRDFLKGRIRGLNESYGNLLQTRRLMEVVWQRRDVGGKEVDVRETLREQGLNLLLI